MAQLDEMPEAEKQSAVADRLVVTKTDIAEGGDVARLRDRLAAMNPFASITTAVNGELDPAMLADIAPRSSRAGAAELDRGLYATPPREGRPSPGRERFASRSGAHDAPIHAFCLKFD